MRKLQNFSGTNLLVWKHEANAPPRLVQLTTFLPLEIANLAFSYEWDAWDAETREYYQLWQTNQGISLCQQIWCYDCAQIACKVVAHTSFPVDGFPEWIVEYPIGLASKSKQEFIENIEDLLSDQASRSFLRCDPAARCYTIADGFDSHTDNGKFRYYRIKGF